MLTANDATTLTLNDAEQPVPHRKPRTRRMVRGHLMSARSCEPPPPGKAVLIWVSL
jgi:hypothetical protein